MIWNGAAFARNLSADRRASEELLPAIRGLFEMAAVRLEDCQRIAVCSGPGSFTGLRVGLATAWGLSRASGVAAEAVPTLEALADAARGCGAERVAAALDAGRGEVVLAFFDLAGPRARILEPGQRLSRDEAQRRSRGFPLAALPTDLLETPSVPLTTPLSTAVAWAVARAPQPTGPLEATAIYSRPSAAEEKRGAA
jgi:tRNA threonylcarbamoyl adenosine modification protein YeaZ